VLCYELAVARWWNDVLRDEIWPFLRSVRLRIMYEVRFGSCKLLETLRQIHGGVKNSCPNQLLDPRAFDVSAVRHLPKTLLSMPEFL